MKPISSEANNDFNYWAHEEENIIIDQAEDSS